MGRAINGVLVGVALVALGVVILRNRDRIRRHNHEVRGAGWLTDFMDWGDSWSLPLLAGVLVVGGLGFMVWSVIWFVHGRD